MGRYINGWWEPDDEWDAPPGGQWKEPGSKEIDLETMMGSMASYPETGGPPNATPLPKAPESQALDLLSQMRDTQQPGMNMFPAGVVAGAPLGGGGEGGELLPGFSSLEQQRQWQIAYLNEHKGEAPYSWRRAAEEKQGAEVWAQQHGSPSSWGNRPGDLRVPLEIWKRISSARRSGDYGPQGPEGWAEAADLMGGGILAMQGKAYHPPAATGATAEVDKMKRLRRLINLGG